MNRETIIQMAREAAAIHGHTFKEVPSPETVEFIEAFYALAVAKEREECAALVQANADACDTYSTARRILESNAAAIRARGEST